MRIEFLVEEKWIGFWGGEGSYKFQDRLTREQRVI